MRFFIRCAYNGTRYNGWQIQPNAASVQQTLQDALSLLTGGQPIEIVGCGRTDAGVHASAYYFHLDLAADPKAGLLHRLNRVLPPDIVLYDSYTVQPEAHARFDAFSRSYEYHLARHKSPFAQEITWQYPFIHRADPELLQAAASLLLDYEEFAPFCKTHSDAKTMRCTLTRSEWEWLPDRLIYHISANRFLRGMVRLMVGMCLNVAIGKLTLDQVRSAMERQVLLPKSYSVPPNGLFLSAVSYPPTVFISPS